MNDDPFEDRLKALHRRDLAAEWKADILAVPSAKPVSFGPPRWLAWSLGAAWMLVLTLHLLTPSDAVQSGSETPLSASYSTVQERQALLSNLLAINLSPSSP